MRSPRVLVLLLLLALAVATVSAGSVSAPTTAVEQRERTPVQQVAAGDGIAYNVRQANGTTGYLAMNDSGVLASGYGTTTLDVSTAVAVDATRLHGEYRSATLEAAFENTTNQTARERLLSREARRIETRLDALETRQRRTIASYNSGTLSEREFLYRLARIDAAADETADRITLVQDDLVTTSGFSLPSSLQTRYKNVQAELVPLQGPVRDRVARSASGEVNDTRVYYVTGAERVTLATTTDRSYLRESYLGNERVEGGTDTFAQSDLPRIGVAYTRAAELYPWVFNNTAPPGRGFGNTSVYSINATHGHGRLTAYLDGNTTNVYRELQRKRLAGVPTETTSNRTDALQLSVARTHETGPMKVTVLDTDGSPVDAQVRVNDDRAGSTGEDGIVWTVTPRDSVRVTVRTAANETATVRFTPD